MVRAVVDRLRRDPGLALALLAMVIAALVYAPTVGHGLVNYDDPWLIGDNWIVQHPSWASLRTIWFDLHSPLRFVLTPEYLPIRDVSIMLDFAVWGHWWGGFHLVAIALYVAAIGLWFVALTRFGVERVVAGLAVLVWAVHPSHAESVAWLSERKGLLAMAWAGACAIGFARFRAGGSVRWLALGVVAGVCAVWSKAHGAFAIASLAGLELVLPALRASWRRSLVGLAAIGVAAGAAFVPVLLLAADAQVVGTSGSAPAGRVAMVLGVHGFYLREGAMAVRNAVAYPLATSGPSGVDLALGALGFVALAALFAWRPRGADGSARASAAMLRAGGVLWIAGWLPVGHLILPLQMVLVADRYLLIPSMGLAVIVAVALAQIDRRAVQVAAVAAIALAGIARTLDAETSWRDPQRLWERAVASNPADPGAWAMYVEAVADATDDPARVAAILDEGLKHGRSPRLVMHQGLIALATDRVRGTALMREAALGGEGQAMSNLALLRLEDGDVPEALAWAERGAVARPRYVHAQRTLGKVALAAGPAALPEARAAFERAFELEPGSCANGVNLGLVLVAQGQPAAAIPRFAACVRDRQLGARAASELARARALAGAPPAPRLAPSPPAPTGATP